MARLSCRRRPAAARAQTSRLSSLELASVTPCNLASRAEPNFTCLVEPLACCVTQERLAKYTPIQAGKWLLGKYGETHKDYTVPDGALVADNAAATAGV